MGMNDDLKLDVSLYEELTFDDYQEINGRWVDRTPGFVGTTIFTCFDHIKDEIKEADEALTRYKNAPDILRASRDLDDAATELIDVMVLTFDWFNKAGFSVPIRLIQKWNKVMDRTYSKPDARGVVRHDDEPKRKFADHPYVKSSDGHVPPNEIRTSSGEVFVPAEDGKVLKDEIVEVVAEDDRIYGVINGISVERARDIIDSTLKDKAIGSLMRDGETVKIKFRHTAVTAYGDMVYVNTNGKLTKHGEDFIRALKETNPALHEWILQGRDSYDGWDYEPNPADFGENETTSVEGVVLQSGSGFSVEPEDIEHMLFDGDGELRIRGMGSVRGNFTIKINPGFAISTESALRQAEAVERVNRSINEQGTDASQA